jgi:hypothetical protein
MIADTEFLKGEIHNLKAMFSSEVQLEVNPTIKEAVSQTKVPVNKEVPEVNKKTAPRLHNTRLSAKANNSHSTYPAPKSTSLTAAHENLEDDGYTKMMGRRKDRDQTIIGTGKAQNNNSSFLRPAKRSAHV